MESKEEKDDQFQMKKEKDLTNEGIDNIFY